MSQDQVLLTINNELTSTLPALTFKGEIIVVDREELVSQACADLASHTLIGFDTETRPSFKAGVTYKVSLLQLSTPSHCYLFRLNKIALSSPIVEILESEEIVKLGADVAGDIRSLNQLHKINERGFYDLQNTIWEWGIGEKSLRKMSALTLGQRISKAQRLSNWEAVSLTPQQQSYAATDAWACIEIYNKLLTMKRLTNEQIALIKAEQAQRLAEAAERRRIKEETRAKHKSSHFRPRRKRSRAQAQRGEKRVTKTE